MDYIGTINPPTWRGKQGRITRDFQATDEQLFMTAFMRRARAVHAAQGRWWLSRGQQAPLIKILAGGIVVTKYACGGILSPTYHITVIGTNELYKTSSFSEVREIVTKLRGRQVMPVRGGLLYGFIPI